MHSYDKLMGLIEDAASSITQLRPEGISPQVRLGTPDGGILGTDLKSLKNVLNNIKGRIGKLKDVPADILKEAKGASSDALKSLEKILKNEVKDTDKAIELVSGSILEIQKLIGKLKAAADGENLAASLNTEEGQQKDARLESILVLSPRDSAVRRPLRDLWRTPPSGVPKRTYGEEKQESSPKAYKGPERRANELTDRRASGEGDRRATGSVEEKIKVSTSRLDKLVNMAGELVIAQLMVSEEVNTTLSSEHSLVSKVSHQGKLIRELQELSMSMRMVPIQGVFQKMARLVRDLSYKADKKISLVISGEETELDRSIVDNIADPLVHMIRNSIDHGIESPEERVQAGKDAVGRINLRAFHQAGNIVIEIQDDGKGLNTERILQKAIDNGVVSKGQDLSNDQICKLIFHAGLSTAQEVTSVSGRGVGMDVVRKNIESLRGKIDISTTPGKGTVFTISFPLTLAIIDGNKT